MAKKIVGIFKCRNCGAILKDKVKNMYPSSTEWMLKDIFKGNEEYLVIGGSSVMGEGLGMIPNSTSQFVALTSRKRMMLGLCGIMGCGAEQQRILRRRQMQTNEGMYYLLHKVEDLKTLLSRGILMLSRCFRMNTRFGNHCLKLRRNLQHEHWQTV